MTEDRQPDQTLLFRPDTFFLKPWRGWGVVRDARGRSIDHFECFGQGKTGTRSATTSMTYVFKTGQTQTVEWDILSDDEGHFYARDLKSGLEGRGRAVGDDFRWTFQTPAPGRLGKFLKSHTTATYTLVSADTALGVTEFRVFGILVRTLMSFFRHT